jgi:hypothetical protein
VLLGCLIRAQRSDGGIITVVWEALVVGVVAVAEAGLVSAWAVPVRSCGAASLQDSDVTPFRIGRSTPPREQRQVNGESSKPSYPR